MKKLKLCLVEMSVELDDQKKAAMLLGAAVDKEVAIYRQDICEINDQGAMHVRRESQQHQDILAKSLEKVDVLASVY